MHLATSAAVDALRAVAKHEFDRGSRIFTRGGPYDDKFALVSNAFVVN